ncbi:MAG: hypothetical protein ACLFPF_10880 [Halanaerobiales bacterium]
MPARIDLPDAEIAKLRDSEGLTYVEIKDRLNLDCSTDTVARHYHQWKEEHDTVVDEIVEGVKGVSEEIEEAAGEISDEIGDRVQEFKTDTKNWWERFKEWLFSWGG